MDTDSRHPEQFILIGAVLCRDLHADIAIKDKIIIYFYILAAVDINTVRTQIPQPDIV